MSKFDPAPKPNAAPKPAPNLRDAAEQALEALESSRVFVTTREKIKHPEGTEWYDERITALRAALAQPEQREMSAGNVTRNICPTCESLARTVMLDQTGKA